MPIKSKEDRAAYDRAYRAKNAERKAAYAAQWRLDNAEHLKRRAAKRRLEKRAMCLIAAECRISAPGGPVLRYLVDLSRLRLTYSALG